MEVEDDKLAGGGEGDTGGGEGVDVEEQKRTRTRTRTGTGGQFGQEGYIATHSPTASSSS